jgi:hypothetical protein
MSCGTRFFNTGFLRLISCKASSPPWSYSRSSRSSDDLREAIRPGRTRPSRKSDTGATEYRTLSPRAGHRSRRGETADCFAFSPRKRPGWLNSSTERLNPARDWKAPETRRHGPVVEWPRSATSQTCCWAAALRGQGPARRAHARRRDPGPCCSQCLPARTRRAEALAEIGDRQHRVGRSGVSSVGRGREI